MQTSAGVELLLVVHFPSFWCMLKPFVAGSMLFLMFDTALLSHFKKYFCTSDCSEGNVRLPKFCTQVAFHCYMHAIGLSSVKQENPGYWVVSIIVLAIGGSLLKTVLEIFRICLNLKSFSPRRSKECSTDLCCGILPHFISVELAK